MDLDELTIPASRLWVGETPWTAPLALVDLDEPAPAAGAIALPPLAGCMDAIVEPPVSVTAIARQVLAAPLAAAVTVQLLRLLPSLAVEHALAAESLAYATLQGSEEHVRWRKAQAPVRPAPDAGKLDVVRDGAQLVLTLDRPQSGNAIDSALRDQLYEAFTLAALDAGIERIVLQAQGKAFSLGADLAEFGTTTDPASAHAIRALTLPALPASRCAGRLEAHVQGACVGAGLELAAWAHRITASPSAWFQLPELAMGILPGAGGCVSLSRRIGRQRTALMVLSGRRLSARQALDWGLVDEIVDDAA
jgi:hypothetical protein